MAISLKYKYVKTYTETLLSGVGVNGAGRTLIEPLDANCIFVAPNGNDGWAGTRVAPKLTISAAIAALGAKTTVWVIRNAYVGDLTFAEAGGNGWTLPANKNIQADLGEVVTCQNGAGTSFVFNTNCQVSGIRFNSVALAFAFHMCMTLGSGVTFFFCDFIINNGVSSTCVSTEDSTFAYCYFRHSGSDVAYAGYGCIYGGNAAKTIIVTNCIFMDVYLAIRSVSILMGAPWTWLTIDNSYFINCTYCLIPTNTALSVTTAFTACAFFSCEYVISDADTTNIANFESCYFDALLSTPATACFIINNNPLQNIAPLLCDFQGCLDENYITRDLTKLRLQLAGKTIAGTSSKYYMDSPLHEYAPGPYDVSPFIETVALASEGFTKYHVMEYAPVSLSMQNNCQNFVELSDIRGNIHTYYDAERRQFTLGFGDNVHISNRQIKEFREILADTGTAALYPLGFNGNLYDTDSIISGNMDQSALLFTPDDTALHPLIVDHWRGFWITIDGDDFYISGNDESSFTIVDKLGNGVPIDGHYAFSISYILVNNSAQSFAMKQNNFTVFLKGGEWRENEDTCQPYDLSTDQIVLKEVEDLEETI